MFRRPTVAVLLLLVMVFQTMTVAFFPSPRDNLVDLTHAAMHWQQEGHHHHGAGDYHADDSDESTRHLMADLAGTFAALPATDLQFSRQDSSTHATLSAPGMPHPYLEGLLRPPRPTA